MIIGGLWMISYRDYILFDIQLYTSCIFFRFSLVTLNLAKIQSILQKNNQIFISTKYFLLKIIRRLKNPFLQTDQRAPQSEESARELRERRRTHPSEPDDRYRRRETLYGWWRKICDLYELIRRITWKLLEVHRWKICAVTRDGQIRSGPDLTVFWSDQYSGCDCHYVGRS